MVHSAYDSFELLSDCPTKIESIESYGSKLLLGCSDGSLRIYAPESSGSDRSPTSSDYHTQTSELRKEPYVLEKNVAGFSRRPLVSMEVLESKELLLSLSESIAFHRLPSLETIAVLTKAKGANVYSWDDRRGFLCFARQKRVCIFRHDGGRGFVEVKEFGVPDMVKSMSWCGENICLGIRREYMILNSTNGALSEIFPSGRLAPPLVVSLPSGQLLLGKVRSLRAPYPLIQTVVLRNVRHLLQSNNSAIVALDNSVYGLFPVPLGAQIVQLTASGNFEEALALCKLLPPEDASLRAAKEGSIHIRYAHYLFDNGKYEEAMEHFLASQVDITYVLSLYPSIVLPKTTSVPEPEKLMDISWDSSHLSRASSDVSDDMESLPAPHLSDSDESAALRSKKMSHNTLMALVKFMQKKRYSIIEKATAEGTEEVVFDAVGDNFVSYDSSRFKKVIKGRGNIPFSSSAREMAAILDTALLQALLLTPQSSAALELLKGVNYCDVKICEEILQKSKNYTALLELYKGNSMHHEALKLLNQLIEESKSNEMPAELTQKFKPESIIEYLKPLCGTDPMLVLEFSMLVLESCPTQTIELFLSGNIPADLVNSYLKQHAPNMQARYLELMLAMNQDGISGNLQNEMVHIYLSEVLEWYSDLRAQQNWDEKNYSPTRKKLLSALESISGYNPEALLKRLPADALYEERAILLGKMNQHELALSLYVHKLHVPDLALSYCDHVYESLLHQPSARSSGNIYLTLMQIYLNPQRTTKNFEKRITNFVSPQTTSIPKVGSATSVKGRGRAAKKIAEIEGAEDFRVSQSSTDSGRSDGDADEFNEEGSSTIMLDEVLDLLSRRWDRINGAQALKLLPRETKLQNLLPFLGPLFKKSSEAYRNFSVIKSLRQSENLQVKDELYNQRKAVVKITSDSMCSLCNKKIGTSVFAVYPNGKTLVHFVCFRDSQSMKAVGKGLPLRKK
ncbi:Clathrin, heavy chain [Parasponia andersonii]|uniref:Clathrin, heavy chain n=1 Tax=Parasponia andersonii TaxID=3476 RepID=A0A2P5D348_PARAD|nr:Clathrin, heavy chain [Parasponia andersonii]